jgi:hypothetical protein
MFAENGQKSPKNEDHNIGPLSAFKTQSRQLGTSHSPSIQVASTAVVVDVH